MFGELDSHTDLKFDVELPESSGTVGELEAAAANSNAVDEPPDELWYPDEGSEPNLDADLLYKLDRVADDVEIQRLLLKGVLRPATVCEAENQGAMKSLSTKMVRTWRSKKRQGKASYLGLLLEEKQAGGT